MSAFSELLHASTSEANLLVLFIPSADREGDALGRKEQKRWVRKALKMLQCFTNEAALRTHTAALRQFMTDLGTATRQGAVACVLDRTMYQINFPLEGA